MNPHPYANNSFFHTLVNIGLSVFLISVATVGVYSLNGFERKEVRETQASSLENVMVCGIGLCKLT